MLHSHSFLSEDTQTMAMNLELTSPSLPDNDQGMVALASRIQDRAMHFFTEQNKLSSLREKLDEIKSLEEKEANINRFLRRNLLETTRSRHDIELELHQVRDQTSDFIQSIQELKEETESIQQETQRVETKLKRQVKDVYAPHEAQIELFVRTIQIDQERQESLINQERERKRQVKERITNLKQEEQAFREEIARLEAQRKDLEAQHLQGDIQISNLRDQVQNAISEVRKSCIFSCNRQLFLNS